MEILIQITFDISGQMGVFFESTVGRNGWCHLVVFLKLSQNKPEFGKITYKAVIKYDFENNPRWVGK